MINPVTPMGNSVSTCHHLTPATARMTKLISPMKAAVPKSSITTRPHTSPISMQSGRNRVQYRRMSGPILAHTPARKKIIVHFANSDG